MDFSKGIGSELGPVDRPLTRQGSVYALTFDEFQSTLGKDFGSMNMDELLKSIWTAEETQAMAALGGGTSSVTAAPGCGIQRQGSLTLPRTLSQKTVDQVWRDLVKENTASTSGACADAAAAAAIECQPHRQQTLGEMTLEEFLVRAGVVREDVVPPGNIITGNGNGTINDPGSNGNNLFYNSFMGNNSNAPMGNSTAAAMPLPLRSYGAGGMVGMGDPVVSMSNRVMGPSGVVVGHVASPDGALGKVKNGDVGSLSPVMPYEMGGGMRSVKKGSGVEKVVERRQRRMIKNRESAARSRARKQAYTMELEAEVAKLKEQNKELQKKQDEMMKLQKNQVMDMLNHQCGAKKRCLRRTQTGPW
ncbi:Abscisic acid responsive elements-binding factor 2 [Rhynchospora pubera]|uniref:Abscisic acid responsive elements-binding factor 2 n=1 Tax=Rhynchospora pubera TaxID=906938 RepID=A0AAV8AP77_9POAL|nr:Abscisic acid responsive elements-binding factor 2 [Rhynchospora pubera]KAJ4800947.1 Abscisic acid responsive elements-binding factor 2 [Rhynchospora pubera]